VDGRTALVNESDHDRSTLDATEVGVLVHPGAHLFGVLRFEAPVGDVVAGRRCWKARATTDPGCQTFRPIPFGLRLAGIEHTFWFDRETGIVLRHLGSVDSRPCSMVEFKEVWVNPFIEEGIFEFEPSAGTLVHRRTDHLIRMAERAGADLVESVKFLRADEVVVWFSVAVDGRRLEAASRLRSRVVRLGSAWMVEHATFDDLVRPTGVEVPPPEDAERS
jgi:hypothetical protein